MKHTIIIILAALFTFSFQASASSGSSADSFTVLRSTKFKAKHRQHYRKFSVAPDKLTGSEFTLLVQNGKKVRLRNCSKLRRYWKQRRCKFWNLWRQRLQRYTRVYSGQILINGEEVVGPGQLNRRVDKLEIPISLEQYNKLEVNLRGHRHSFIRVKIIGKQASNQIPLADLTTENGETEFLTGQVVNFDASGSSDADGSVVEYRWDYGDGTTEVTSTPAASHSYAAAGSYTATLVVVDDQGAESVVAELDILVVDPAPLVASFSTIPDDLNGPRPFTVTSMNTSSSPDSDIVSVDWVTTDGGAGSGETFVHTFNAPGTFQIIMTVTDSLGRTETVSKDVVVTLF